MERLTKLSVVHCASPTLYYALYLSSIKEETFSVFAPFGRGPSVHGSDEHACGCNVCSAAGTNVHSERIAQNGTALRSALACYQPGVCQPLVSGTRDPTMLTNDVHEQAARPDWKGAYSVRGIHAS